MQTISTNHRTSISGSSLDHQRWNNILNSTSGFKLPGVEKDVISPEVIEGFKRGIMDVIRFICQQQTDAYGFRVYLDGKKMPKEYINDKVFTVIPAEGDDGQNWLQEVFNDQKFGIILNYSEKFSLPLADQLSVLLEPLLDTIGIPSSGMHTTVFIGNYGFTPLGIHQDHYGANVIHFHLGPGDKVMYTWDPEHYESNAMEGKPLDEVLPYASEYPFGTGDLYFMPWDQYHVGRTDEISIGLTVWFDNHSNKALLDRLLSSIHRQFNKEELKEITGLEKDINHLNYANIDKILGGNPLTKDISFKQLLKLTFEEFKLALFSNRGWRGIPVTMEQLSDFKVDDHYYELKNKDILVPRPYQLYYTISESEITVFARGAKIIIKHHPLLEQIIGTLNQNTVINTDILLDQLNNVWPQEAGLYFLAMIYNKRGFNLVGVPSSELV
jgi:hypothetical protein